MKISAKTYNQLVNGGVDIGMMAKAYNMGVDAREIKSERVGQNKTAFLRSETSRIQRDMLTPSIELALTIAAFDAAMLRTEKTWGSFNWALPEPMLDTAIRYWPHKAAVPTEDSQP